jgi:hypothetical protein
VNQVFHPGSISVASGMTARNHGRAVIARGRCPPTNHLDGQIAGVARIDFQQRRSGSRVCS